MRKRKQKAIAIPKAPTPVMSQQPNQQVRRLGMSALRQSFNVNSIQSYPELLAALEAQAVQITLGANIIVPDNILINHDVAINFNGYNIISEETSPGARVFDIRSGEVTLTGKGKIFAMGARSVAIRVFGAISMGVPAYTVLTVDEGISIFAPDSYGILVSANLGVAYGLVINFAGEIVARDGIGLSSRIRGRETNLPTVNIRSGARIRADETMGAALMAAGYAVWKVGAAQLTGATGALLKSGQVEFSHAEVIATGEGMARDAEKREVAHAAIRVAAAAKHDLKVVVEGGSYLGEKSFAVAGDGEALESFVIRGGDFSGALDVLHHAIETDLEIEEGSFSLHPALHLKAIRPEITLLPEPEVADVEEVSVAEVAKVETAAVQESGVETVAAGAGAAVAGAAAVEEVAPEEMVPALPLPPVYDEAECAEKIAMQNALMDAVNELKKLRASDYEAGFVDLTAAIREAEELLAGQIMTPADVREMSGKLLAAFDNLEERSEFSLTDDELDELFYHGAVLDELAEGVEMARAEVERQEVGFEGTAKVGSVEGSEVSPAVVSATEFVPEEVDFAELSRVVGEIAALEAAECEQEGYGRLLAELARVREVLADATQAEVDAAARRLKVMMVGLARAANGVAMIDEMDPHLCLSPHKEKPEVRERKVSWLGRVTAAVAGFFGSVKAGIRAGVEAYREMRRAAKREKA